MECAGFVAFVGYDFAFSGTRILGLLEQIINTHAISIGWLCCETCEEYMQGKHVSFPFDASKLRFFHRHRCRLFFFFFEKKTPPAACRMVGSTGRLETS
jgi:hypothetical protein